jgi:hypothetical protein
LLRAIVQLAIRNVDEAWDITAQVRPSRRSFASIENCVVRNPPGARS